MRSPEEKANPFSKLTFWWANRYFIILNFVLNHSSTIGIFMYPSRLSHHHTHSYHPDQRWPTFIRFLRHSSISIFPTKSINQLFSTFLFYFNLLHTHGLSHFPASPPPHTTQHSPHAATRSHTQSRHTLYTFHNYNSTKLYFHLLFFFF